MVDCVCEGNWRLIVSEYEDKIGTRYQDEKGDFYIFFGLVHGGDDYYYGMWSISDNQCKLLSCVGSPEGHGFSQVV